MSKHNNQHSFSIEHQKGRYYYEINQKDSSDMEFGRIEDRGLDITHKMGWDMYFWDDIYTFDATVRMGYANQEKDRILVRVDLIDTGTKVPDKLHNHLLSLGFTPIVEEEQKFISKVRK